MAIVLTLKGIAGVQTTKMSASAQAGEAALAAAVSLTYPVLSTPVGISFGMPITVWVLNTVPGISSKKGNSGSVQPMQGMPARVFEDCRFQRMRLHGECVIGPRQPRS